MARFRFRLDRVLALKRQVEDAAARAKADAERARNDFAAECDRLVAERAAAEGSQAVVATGLRHLGPLVVEALRPAIAATTADLHAADEELTARAEALRVAATERRALERLREDALLRHRRAEAVAEQRMLDEIAVMRAARPHHRTSAPSSGLPPTDDRR